MAFTTSYSFARSGYFRWQYSNTASTSWGNDNIRQGNYGKHQGGTGSGYWSYCGIIDVSEADKTKIKTQYASAYPTKIELAVTRASAGSTGSTISNARVGVGQGLYNSVIPSNQQSYISVTLNGGSGTASTITLNQTMADYYCSSAQGSTNRIISFGHIPDIKTTSVSTPYTAISTTGTLKITWEYRTYTISYNANGGTGAPDAQTKTHGTALTLSSTKPTRTGYTFQGWSTSSTATTATYAAGGTFPAATNANTTLYAVWKINSYENILSHWAWGFENQEGNNNAKTAFQIDVDTFSANYNSSVTFNESRATTIPNGFYHQKRFASQSYTSDNSWEYLDLPVTKTQPAKSTWVDYYYRPTNYTITYNLDGGTNNSSNPSSYTVLYGVTLAAPTRENYEF